MDETRLNSTFNIQHLSSSLAQGSKRIRRPRSRYRDRDALAGVASRELVVKLLQPGFLVAVDQDVKLRKGTIALLTGFGDGLASQFVEHCALDLRYDLLF